MKLKTIHKMQIKKCRMLRGATNAIVSTSEMEHLPYTQCRYGYIKQHRIWRENFAIYIYLLFKSLRVITSTSHHHLNISIAI